MELLSKKSIEKESHNLSIEVYPNYIEIMVLLPQELYFDIVEEVGYGNYDAERYAINKFTKTLFSIKYEKALTFNSASELVNAMLNLGVDLNNNGNNNFWFKKVILPIDENNFEQELEKHIDYIKKCSTEFERNSISGKKKIVKNILNKL